MMPKLESLCGKDHTYMGWTNYETWNVALWIDNEQGTHEHWTGRAAEILATSSTNEHWTDDQYHRFTLADELRESHDEARPEISGAYGDLLGAALSEVDWNEVAKHLLDIAGETS